MNYRIENDIEHETDDGDGEVPEHLQIEHQRIARWCSGCSDFGGVVHQQTRIYGTVVHGDVAQR